MWPFGRKKKQRIVVRRYTAVTGGGLRKQYEQDVNKMAERGYRLVNTVDHAKGRFAYGTEMVATYELVEPEKK